MQRREFIIKKIVVNGKAVKQIVVDPHVQKHKDITDDIIIDLVKQLDGTDNLPDDVSGDFEYYANFLDLHEKRYRVIWLMEKGKLYIGVITIYRDNRRKK